MSDTSSVAWNERSKLVSVAEAIIEGNVNPIEGARRICAMAAAIGQHGNEALMLMRAIESETDHFPLGEMRNFCAVEYLHRMDAELEEYLASANQDILEACEEIIRAFS